MSTKMYSKRLVILQDDTNYVCDVVANEGT